MIRKLRRQFTAAAMLSMFIVLAVLMGVINIFNYSSTVRDADETLAMLSENRGRFPEWMTELRAEDAQPPEEFSALPEEGEFRDRELLGGRRGDFKEGFSPELPFSSRYFSVLVDAEGNTCPLDMEHIAAVDAQTASQMASEAVAGGKTTGFSSQYRYALREQEDGVLVTFLDCSAPLAVARSFLWTSVIVSLLGLGAVFLLMLFLSGRFTRPMAESYEKQKRFITDAGHEIKTPLTIIDADAEVLSMDLPENNEWIEDIRAQTRRLAGLTNDLIFLSKMDEERPQLQSIDFPFSDVAAEAAASFRSRAVKENKTFRVDIQPMITLCGDEKALRQLVNILTDNALKYSPEGGNVFLTLKKAGKNAALVVTNTCESIPEGDLNELFDRFYRSERSRNSSTGGHGLGLSIAQAVVNAHRGKISVSAPDEHTMRFEALLPLSVPK